MRAEHSLRMFENKVLRKIYVPKRYKVTGEWSITMGRGTGGGRV